jgi:hypothetical protein
MTMPRALTFLPTKAPLLGHSNLDTILPWKYRHDCMNKMRSI